MKLDAVLQLTANWEHAVRANCKCLQKQGQRELGQQSGTSLSIRIAVRTPPTDLLCC